MKKCDGARQGVEAIEFSDREQHVLSTVTGAGTVYTKALTPHGDPHEAVRALGKLLDLIRDNEDIGAICARSRALTT